MFLYSIFMFIILLSIVVLFHEFGHFIVGKFFKIGVQAFSIGFGKAIVKIRRGETDYRINWIPFGGYVKFLGEMPDEEELSEEDKKRAFNLRPPYQKLLVVLAGPVMNIVLGFLIFSVMFMVGFPTSTSRIGYVQPDSPAAQAGIIPGDKVVEIDGESIWRWDDLSKKISKRAEVETKLKVERDGQVMDLTVTPKLSEGRNIFGLPEKRGMIGIGETGLRPLVGVPDPNSIAGQAGVKIGDMITAVDGTPVVYQDNLIRSLADGKAHTLELVDNFEEPQENWNRRTVDLPEANGPGLAGYGIEFADMYVYKLEDGDNPARAAGIQPHDKILSIEGQPMTDWNAFTGIVRESPDKPLSVSLLRNGEVHQITLTPELKQEKDLMGEDVAYGRIGVWRMAATEPPEMKPERYANPIKILQRGVELSFYWTVVTIKAFVYIFTGDVSPKAVGGPITIAVMAGQSAKLGVFPFFLLMAIISLNLAVINLVPMPVLDGGHVMFYLIESIRGKPLDPKIMEHLARIGFAILMLLIVLIMYNDISRFSYNIKDMFLRLF